MEYQCKKCGSPNMFTEKVGSNVGLYCQSCGKWQKWLNKNENRAFEHKMREATKEEQEDIQKNIDQISKPTGNDFHSEHTIVENLNEFIDFLNKEIDRQLTAVPRSSEDNIAKCASAYAYEQVKVGLLNIIHGRKYNDEFM